MQHPLCHDGPWGPGLHAEGNDCNKLEQRFLDRPLGQQERKCLWTLIPQNLIRSMTGAEADIFQYIFKIEFKCAPNRDGHHLGIHLRPTTLAFAQSSGSNTRLECGGVWGVWVCGCVWGSDSP